MKYVLPLLALSATVFATDLSVNIDCNGQGVGQLEISVFDRSNMQIPGLNTTDSNGSFVITNSENYVAPFRLFFSLANGSQCGSYPITQRSATEGTVYLNYYPTDLPCSCSKLMQ